MFKPTTFVVRALMLTLAASALPSGIFAQSGPVLTGQAAFTDYTQEHPGVRRKITLADLPEPKPDESVDNGPAWFHDGRAHGRLPPRASRWRCTHRVFASHV